MATSQSSDALRRIFPRGEIVPIVLRHTSRSGLQRVVDVLEPSDLSSLRHEVADVLGLAIDSTRGGVLVYGTGMDMAAWLTYQLGEKLYDDGYALTYRFV